MAERGSRAPVAFGALMCSLLVVALAGCGGGDAKGSTVTVYVGATLCPAAKADLAGAGGRAGDFRVAAVCLPATQVAAATGSAPRTDLATAGANARRATEDTSAVALLEVPGQAVRFTRPILETAGIPLLASPSGKKAMARTLEAIGEGGGSSIRDGVRDALEPS